jgi:NADH:ubiquinone oxidoreductase subunit 4 (subunit M)
MLLLSTEAFVSQLNVGNIDRALRILVGLVLVVLASMGLIGIWGYIGVVLIATGMIALCPLYTLLGVRTTSR